MQYIRRLGSWVLLAAVATVSAGWGLDRVDLDNHESYTALAVRGIINQDQWLDDQLSEQPVPPATTLNRWMVPQLNGVPWLGKTPLAYWAPAGLVKMGLPMDEVTIRLPSVIASVLTVLVIFGVGRRMIGPRAALMGALMLAASLGMVRWGRSARPELLLTIWMTAAMACFWAGMRAASGAKRAAWLMAGWGAMGLANLSKEFVPLFLVWPLLAYLAWRATSADGDADRARRRLAVFLAVAVAGVVVVDVMRRAMQWWQLEASVAVTAIYACLIGLPLLGYFLICRPWGQLRLVLPTLAPGLLLMALLFVPWFLYIGSLFPWTSETLWQQVGARGVGTEGWTSLRTPGFYLSNMVVLTLPWTVFLPGAVMVPLMGAPRRKPDEQTPGPLPVQAPVTKTHQPTEHADGLVYLLLWVFGLILLFSASAGKRVHYILPAVPAMCMLAGYAAEDVFFRHRWFSAGIAKAIVFGYALLGLIVVGAAVLASQAASGGWVSHTVADLLKLAKDQVSPSEVADIGRYFIVPTIVLTGVLLAAAVAMAKDKPSLSFAGLVFAAVALMFTVASRPELVNGPQNAAQEVVWIRSKVPASAPISFWGENNSEQELVYYIGHDLPNAARAREAMTARYGKQDGLRRWEAWMGQDGGRWLLVRATDVDEVKKMGYAIVDPNHIPLAENMDVILFQPPVRKEGNSK
jgi:4-amino-4-deoxy-L-arabinose transferase-like glycosyltransferase